MHLDKRFAKLLQIREANDGAVYAGTSLAVLKNLAADDEFIVVIEFQLCKNLFDFGFIRNIECSFDDRFFFACADHRRLRLVSADHAERFHQDGLAGASFTRDCSKTFMERDACFGNECKAVYCELL